MIILFCAPLFEPRGVAEATVVENAASSGVFLRFINPQKRICEQEL